MSIGANSAMYDKVDFIHNLCLYIGMSSPEAPIESQSYFPSPDSVSGYVDTVRELYREEVSSYRGQRDPDQRDIAELYGDEADQFLDGVVLGALAIPSLVKGERRIDGTSPLSEAVHFGSLEWGDYRAAFRKLAVGFGVITNRLKREGHLGDLPELADLNSPDTMKVFGKLFEDFQGLNALRFGVDGSGVHGVRWRRDPSQHGRTSRMRVDIDKAPDEATIKKTASEREYIKNRAMHIAGKMSPDEYRALRRDFPEIPKEEFDDITGFRINARQFLEEEHSL